MCVRMCCVCVCACVYVCVCVYACVCMCVLCVLWYIGVGAGPVGPVLTGPFLAQINYIHYYYK